MHIHTYWWTCQLSALLKLYAWQKFFFLLIWPYNCLSNHCYFSDRDTTLWLTNNRLMPYIAPAGDLHEFLCLCSSKQRAFIQEKWLHIRDLRNNLNLLCWHLMLHLRQSGPCHRLIGLFFWFFSLFVAGKHA